MNHSGIDRVFCHWRCESFLSKNNQMTYNVASYICYYYDYNTAIKYFSIMIEHLILTLHELPSFYTFLLLPAISMYLDICHSWLEKLHFQPLQ